MSASRLEIFEDLGNPQPQPAVLTTRNITETYPVFLSLAEVPSPH